MDGQSVRQTSTSATTSPTRCAAASSCRSGTPTPSSPPTPASTASTQRPRDARAARRALVARPLDHLPAESGDRPRPRALDDYRRRIGRANAIERFVVDELSNWYIRRNRRRFWKSESDRDKAAAYQTLYECLVSLAKLLAPFIPFLTEAIYQNLVRSSMPTAPESVHLSDYPVVDQALIDEALPRDMAAVFEVVKLGRAARSEAGVKVRQPLPAVLVYSREPASMDALDRSCKDQVLDELNVKDVAPLVDLGDVVAYNIRPKLNTLGPRFGKKLGELRQLLAAEDPVSVADRANAGKPVVLTFADGSTARSGARRSADRSDQTRRVCGRAGSHRHGGARYRPHLRIDSGRSRSRFRSRRSGRAQKRRLSDRGPHSGQRGRGPRSVAALDVFSDYVKTETLADAIETWATPGASDQVEASVNDAPDSDEVFEDQIEAGGHQIQIRLQRA